MFYGENGTVKFLETLADNVFRHNYSMIQKKKKKKDRWEIFWVTQIYTLKSSLTDFVTSKLFEAIFKSLSHLTFSYVMIILYFENLIQVFILYLFQYARKFPIAFIDDVQMYILIIVNIVTVKL